uniref:Uncharacterized protein n=1 Tax=Arundo donax TaxID=35708 RepID=A0A0A9D305_ARUDO
MAARGRRIDRRISRSGTDPAGAAPQQMTNSPNVSAKGGHRVRRRVGNDAP